MSSLNRSLFQLFLALPIACHAQNEGDKTFSASDLALIQPVIKTAPLPDYDYDQLDFAMNRGIARTLTGTLWACWVAGGDNDNAFMLLSRSEDGGDTWSKPMATVDSRIPGSEVNRRNRVGNLWLDPSGKLWLFFDQSMSTFDGRAGLWYSVCGFPDNNSPEWSDPVRVWHGNALNKPVILKNGAWALPVTLWDRGKIKHQNYKDAFHELDSLRMAHVFVSSDQGQTWARLGGVRFPKAQFDEHHIVERTDGSLWMTARTQDGIAQSFSVDGGLTWTDPEMYMEHVSSRHFISRLHSGRLVLIRHGAINEKTKSRSMLMAFLSDDEGKSWKGGLMLDERSGVSYPDGFQSPDGTIFISYDRNRSTDAEILMARFTEEDILAGRFMKENSKPRILISRPLRPGIK